MAKAQRQPAAPKQKTPPAAAAQKSPPAAEALKDPGAPTPDPALAGAAGGDVGATPDPALAGVAGGDTGAGETQDKQPDPAQADLVVTHFHIAGRTDGFRRCGRAWPAAGVEVAAEDLAEGDLERLRAESELVVTPIAKAAE